MKVKIEQMRSQRGNYIANQFLIWAGNKVYFQSYKSIIAVRDLNTNKIELDRDYWDYSRTTGKYRNLFLSEDKKATEAKIKNGTYKLSRLN